MINNIKVSINNDRFSFSDLHSFKFKPGLNLILGANTCGKTSLLDIIKKFNCYEPYTLMNSDVQLFKNFSKNIKNFKNQGTDIKGKVTKFLEYKPQELHEESDLRLMQTDLKIAVLSRYQSKGQGRTEYHKWFSNYIINNAKFTDQELQDLEKEKISYDKGFMIVADEPENSLAINMQFGLFEWFYKFAESYKSHCQIIIATHSIAAFILSQKYNKDINIIEMNKGWINEILNKIKEI